LVGLRTLWLGICVATTDPERGWWLVVLRHELGDSHRLLVGGAKPLERQWLTRATADSQRLTLVVVLSR
jgi:hypothetical protein